jgi:ParB family chromosome partitioning protein
MQINISDIKVRKRIRQDLGNLEPLKNSLKRYGLLNPVTINAKNELIAGQRRLEAAKQLGWNTIPVVVIDTADSASLLEIELEENTQRADFTEDELMDGYSRLERLRNPGLFRRISQSIRSFFVNVVTTQQENRLVAKKKSALMMTIFFGTGLILIIAGPVLYKNGYITSILHGFIDAVAVLCFIAGTIPTARYFFASRHTSR